MYKRCEIYVISQAIAEHAPSRAAGRTALLVFLELRTYAGHSGAAWPSAETLATPLISKRDLGSALKILENALLVRVERTFKVGGGSSNTYTVRDPMDFNPRVLKASSTIPTVTRLTDFRSSGTTDIGKSRLSYESPIKKERIQSDFQLSTPKPGAPKRSTNVEQVWTSWKSTHAEWRAGKGLRKSSPKRSTFVDKISAAVRKHDVSDLIDVIEWAHKSNDYHATILQEGKYLSPAHLFRLTKLPAKIAMARTWRTDGNGAGPVVRGQYDNGVKYGASEY